MKNFVGIDLGTTNSAICSYDGSDTRVWKSPQQNDVTPSAIYIDRRGNKQIGFNAYNMAPQSPDNSAMLFKIRIPEQSSPFLRRLTRCRRMQPCRLPAWPVSAKLR